MPRTPRYGVAPTPRQVEILHLMASGTTIEAIAKKTHVAPSTVKTQMQTLYRRLGAHSAPQAVAIAFQLGILRPSYLREEERFWIHDDKGERVLHVSTRKEAEDMAAMDAAVTQVHREARYVTPWTDTGDVLDVSPPTLTARGGHASGPRRTA